MAPSETASENIARHHVLEVLFNILLGITICGGSMRHSTQFFTTRGFGTTPEHGLHWAVALLGLIVAVLIGLRQPAIEHGSWKSLLVSLPSFAAGGLASSAFLGAAPSWWHLLLIAGGTSITAWSFLSLGKSFSILPARRSTVVSGPYRFIRHPAYLGELLVVLGCCLAVGSWASGLLFVATLAWLVPRMRAEEDLLSACATYREYKKQTQYRLIFGIY